jgi:predicted DNA-binding protein (UPF0251 family)
MNSGLMNSGLMLVKKAPQRCVVGEFGVLREGSTGRVVEVVPRIWAVAAVVVVEPEDDVETHVRESGHGAPEVVETQEGSRPKVEMAFYRKYSEGMLRRYLRLSTQAGRVPSLLGRELFRGNVSHYQNRNFEDVVVFCMDLEKCLSRLTAGEKDLIRRITLQEYTYREAAAVMGVSLRYVSLEYLKALDRVTTLLMDAKLLDPLKSCQ